MQIRHATNPSDFKTYSTERIREDFLVESVMEPEKINLVYAHYDRVISGGAHPVNTPIELPTIEALKSAYFLERRELGIINIAGNGSVEVDGEVYTLQKLDCLYVGLGAKKVVFKSDEANQPAKFYLVSAPAHRHTPTRKMAKEEASPTDMGSSETANERTIYKYIHGDGLASSQLVMGLTVLKPGSVWNTMPAHLHDRRMEVYFYFDLPDNARIFHLMGEPSQTRHLVVANEQAIFSPSWSIHSGAGTSNYAFIWAMAGENYNYTDVDAVAMQDLR